MPYNSSGNEVEACPLLARREQQPRHIGAFRYAESGHACPLFFCADAQEILWRCIANNMADLMMNEEIRDREVRVIDQNGEQLGVGPEDGAGRHGRSSASWPPARAGMPRRALGWPGQPSKAAR